MRVLFIGGTGLISSACVTATEQAGHDLWLLNRGRSSLPTHVSRERVLVADATDPESIRGAVRGHRFDVVVQWVGFAPAHVAQDVETFADAGQYIYISSASAYQKPPPHWLITESTPLINPFWEYSRQKAASEQVLRDAHATTGFPATIVRPSHTYGDPYIPVMLTSHGHPFTIVDRMRRGARIVIPGDGTSLWTLTHNSDFAKGLIGLYGQSAALGEDFHITSDEALSWNQIYGEVAAAAGAELAVVHVPSEALAAADPELEGGLFGDKVYTTVFDNSKLRQVVPGFRATVPFSQGIRRTLAWFDADPARRSIDHDLNAFWDRIIAVYSEALARVAR